MSAPERIWVTPDDTMGWGVAWARDRVENVIKPSIEYARADTVAEMILQAVQAEMEACADVVAACADAFAQVAEHPGVDTDEVRRSESILRSIAAAIRARGDA